MFSYLIRQILLDSLAGGPPYHVLTRAIASPTQLLTELESRGLITSGPFPVLTEIGIAEAKWFSEGPNGDGEVA